MKIFSRTPVIPLVVITLLVLVIVSVVLSQSGETSTLSYSPTAPMLTKPATTAPTITANNQWMSVIKNFDGVDMVLVPPGCFMMGSTEAQITSGRVRRDEFPQTRISFTQQLWIDKTPVWQTQFKKFSGVAVNTSNFTGDMLPVENITWFEANTYCTKNRGGRLPTEAEWEYAARGPDNLIYPWGNSFDPSRVVYSGNSNSQTAEVNRTDRIASSWVGANDMAGDVWQWTSSIYKPYPYIATDGRESKTDATSDRVLRGGAWANDSSVLRSAVRGTISPVYWNFTFGFRCVRSSS